MMTLHITATNVLNHPVWGTGLGFLTDANITSTTFGQTTAPISKRSESPRADCTFRTEIKF